MDVDVDVPREGVPFMSEQWRENFKHAVLECERLGLESTNHYRSELDRRRRAED